MKRKKSTGRALAGRSDRSAEAEAELIQLHRIGFEPLAESCVYLLHGLLGFSYAAIGRQFLSLRPQELAGLIREKLGEVSWLSEASLKVYLGPLFHRLERRPAAGLQGARSPTAIEQGTLAEMLGRERAALPRAARRIGARLRALDFAWACPPASEMVLQAHREDIFNFILVQVNFDRSTAQDLTQKTLRAAARALARYKPIMAQPLTLFKGIAKRIVKQHYRGLYQKHVVWVPLDPFNPIIPGVSPELWLTPPDLSLGQAVLVDVYRRLLALLLSGEKPPWQVIAFLNSRMLQFTPGDMLERYGAYPLREVAWLTAREFAGQYEFLREVIRVEFDKLHRQMDLPISHFEGGILGWRRFGGWLGRPAGDDTFSFYFPEEPGRTPGHAISNAVVSVSRWLLARIQGSAFWRKLLRELDP